MLRKIVLVMFCIVMVANSVFASISFSATFEEVETRLYKIAGKEYIVSVLVITDLEPIRAKIKVNDEFSKSLQKYGEHRFDSDVRIFVRGIYPFEASYQKSRDLVRFSISFPEPPAEIICGDGYCLVNESCEADRCCKGQLINLNNDTNNCGSCNSKCSTDEICDNGICTPFCGNGICDEKENCGSCEADCGCKNNMICETGQCSQLNSIQKFVSWINSLF